MRGSRICSATSDETDIEVVPETTDFHDHVQTRAFGDIQVNRQRSFAPKVRSIVGSLGVNLLITYPHTAPWKPNT